LRALTGCIETRNLSDTTDTIDSRCPELVNAYANWRNNPHSRNDYAHTQAGLVIKFEKQRKKEKIKWTVLRDKISDSICRRF
jgi:hypothetical protein